jgi:hypothetical protein
VKLSAGGLASDVLLFESVTVTSTVDGGAAGTVATMVLLLQLTSEPAETVPNWTVALPLAAQFPMPVASKLLPVMVTVYPPPAKLPDEAVTDVTIGRLQVVEKGLPLGLVYPVLHGSPKTLRVKVFDWSSCVHVALREPDLFRVETVVVRV